MGRCQAEGSLVVTVVEVVECAVGELRTLNFLPTTPPAICVFRVLCACYVRPTLRRN